MARRVCLYCHGDQGEALPHSAWKMYPPDVITSCVCDAPECRAAHEAISQPLAVEDRAVAGVPVESA